MYVLVVGLGSIARRHIRNLRLLCPDVSIVVLRRQRKTDDLGDIAPLLTDVVDSWETVLNNPPTYAFLTNPASYHMDAALRLVEHNVNLFIEKPLAHTLMNTTELIERCVQRGLVLMVGYNFRFYEPLQLLKQAVIEGRIGQVLAFRAEAGGYLPDWRPQTDYSQSVSARRELGGGVLLELSHEVDYARWILGEVANVSAQTGALAGLDIDVEDTADLNLVFANGVLGSIHVDMIQRAPQRGCRLIGTEGTLTWDAYSHNVRLYAAESRTWVDLHPAVELDRNAMYIAELAHFLACLRGEAQPIVTGEDARQTLAVVEAAKQSAAEGQVIHL